jgi:8-oxo-dGTP diphosphatase
MANSTLQNKNAYYKVPQHIIDEINLKLIKNKNIPSNTKQRAKNIITNKFLSYENLKRIKNFFDKNNEVDFDLTGDEKEKQIQQNKNDFMFMGGQKMKNWVESKLKELRNPIHRSKKVKSNFAGFKNQFRTEHSKSFVKPEQQQSIKNKILSELKPKKLMEGEDLSVELPVRLKFAAVCILFNEENRLLLLKRAEDDHWMGGKFALVGGSCEPNEIPEETIIREVKEETNLTIKKPKLCFSTIEGNTFVYVFIAKTNNSDKIKLNDESSGYLWVTSAEVEKHDTVPNLMDMVKKAHEILVANNEAI